MASTTNERYLQLLRMESEIELDASDRTYDLSQSQILKAASATTHVLSTTELLEATLLYVPWKQLFILRGTNMFFKNTIDGSRLLQRKMLLSYQHTGCIPSPGLEALSPLVYDYFQNLVFSHKWTVDVALPDLDTSPPQMALLRRSPRSQGGSELVTHVLRWRQGCPHFRTSPYRSSGSWSTTLLTSQRTDFQITFSVQNFKYHVDVPESAKATLGDLDECVKHFARAACSTRCVEMKRNFTCRNGQLVLSLDSVRSRPRVTILYTPTPQKFTVNNHIVVRYQDILQCINSLQARSEPSHVKL